MSYWAELDKDDVVLRVTRGDNDDPAGDEGYQWLVDNLGGRWIKTSYNATSNGFRKHFAGVGFTYNEKLDAFIPPKCHEEAELVEETCLWTCTNAEHNIEGVDDGAI